LDAADYNSTRQMAQLEIHLSKSDPQGYTALLLIFNGHTKQQSEKQLVVLNRVTFA